ncbi:right-handed parallel beta-helix repeat-containing protein [Streptomyces sp. E11-3]|uniref:right-handed parallel beta-helix repeat-containing protein n=1 Tax=Streptomyces sp. E11-3 TaxID=3110112 RepID=UPI003980F7FE
MPQRNPRIIAAAAGTAVALAAAAGCALPKPYATPAPNAAGGRSYHVSPDGDDKADGLTPDTAWRTLKRADSVKFKAGDRLRLKAGARFRGRLTIGAGDAGNPRKPVIIESYGKGRATIAPAGTRGIEVYNTAGVEVRNLVVEGDDDTFDDHEGIVFFNDLPGGKKLAHVRVSGVNVSGFQNGIRLGGGRSGSGFRDVVVSDSVAHANKDAGVVSDGPAFNATRPRYAHEKVTVSRVKAYSNLGDPGAEDRNTGSGIVLGSVRRGTVQHSVAHDNGARSSAEAVEGPAGIWTFDSTRMTLQRNVSYANHTGSEVDGGGFGLDNNVSSSVMQYNLSYRNDGAGFLAYTAVRNKAHTGNTVRFNISRDDARKLSTYAGIVAFGTRVNDLSIYHNTVSITANDGVRAPALRLHDGLRNVTVRNNVFVTDGAPVVYAESAYPAEQVRLQGNAYFSSGPWALRWGPGAYADLRAWRGRAGQEQRAGSPTGTNADPCLALVPSKGATPAALVPRCAARVVSGAMDLRAAGIDPGPVDYFGARLRTSASIGAVQSAGTD